MNYTFDADAINFRKTIIDNLFILDNSLPDYSDIVLRQIRSKTKRGGLKWFLDLLRLSSFIPENIAHDSSEEKRFSKYTDTLLSYSFELMGLFSWVLDARGRSADVQAVMPKQFDLVGDAKVFRLSRTAKNAKDFKVSSMNDWKHGCQYAILACPIYQLPTSSSAVYKEAETNNVCVLSYSHICLLCELAQTYNDKKLLKEILSDSFSLLNPSTSAVNYWSAVNKKCISTQTREKLWLKEKSIIKPTIDFAKKEGHTYYSKQRSEILSLSHQEAIQKLLSITKIDNKIATIDSISATKFLSF